MGQVMSEASAHTEDQHPDPNLMHIGELARAAGVPVSTLRYYERRGLIGPVARTEGNYRVYAPGTAERLQFIRTAQSAGFTLDDILMLLEFRDGGRGDCAEVDHLITQRMQDVHDRLAELRNFEEELESLHSLCTVSKDSDSCKALEHLNAAASTRSG